MKHWKWMSGVVVLLGICLGGVLLWPRPHGPYVAPAPRLPKELIGEWVQVYPKNGAFTRIRLNDDSTMSFTGTDTAFQTREQYDGGLHPDRWYVDARISFGSVCLLEHRLKAGDCYSVRVVGDTMWLLSRQWPVLVRARAAASLPRMPWSDTHLHGVIEPNDNSFHDVAPIRVR